MHLGDGPTETRVRGEIEIFTSHFPLYAGRW
jgi:hypothetical protein